VELGKLKLPSAWPGLRATIEADMRAILGKLPEKRVEVQVKTVDEMDYPGYTRRRINYFVNDWERLSAWLFIPDGKDEEPGIVCLHQQNKSAKDECAGMEGDSRLAFAQYYAEKGYVTLAPDCPLTGERISSKMKPFDSKPYYKGDPKLSLAGKMLSDHIYAIDVFSDLKRVDTARIGVIGHGLGGFNALMLAAFDDRVRACVASCGFTRFATDKEPTRWTDDEVGLNLMPKLEPMIKENKYPLDWEHILALAAPTATLVLNSLTDTPLSNPKSCEKAVNDASKVYKILGAANAIEYYPHNDGFTVSNQARDLADDWFERWL